MVTNGGNLYLTYPNWLLEVTRGSVFNIAYIILIWVALGILIHFFLTKTVIGRQMFAVGVSEKTSFMAGVNTAKIRVLAFTFAGFFAALGGIVMVGQLGSASSSYGVSLLLPAYATVFLSKAGFKLGYINVPGVICSVALIILGTKGLQLMGMPNYSQYYFQGIALMFAMWLAARTSKVKIE